jgi:hypothetical protein
MLEGPGYMWDSRHVLMTVMFTGAPAAPDPASVYSGPQVIAIRTDGTVFPNGDAWKCLTCGVPEENRQGALVPPNPIAGSGPSGGGPQRPRIALDHPQAFPDGKRVLAGPNVLDCSPYPLTSPQCTPERLRIVPVRWGRTADGSGRGAAFREQRLNPDGVHMEWNAFAPSSGGTEQFGYLGQLVFNPAPRTGEPLVPRYDVENVPADQQQRSGVPDIRRRSEEPWKADPQRTARADRRDARLDPRRAQRDRYGIPGVEQRRPVRH